MPDLTGSGAVFRQCSSGTNDALPCVLASDCPGGSCGAATCHLDQVDLGTPCFNDADCALIEECGPALFDFADRLVSGVGPIVVANIPGSLDLDAEDPVLEEEEAKLK